jgi:hypothetical protein
MWLVDLMIEKTVEMMAAMLEQLRVVSMAALMVGRSVELLVVG